MCKEGFAMTRKEAIVTEMISHFTVDLACFFLLAGRFSLAVSPSLLGGGYLIFVLLSFGLRPFLGAVLDEFPRFPSQSVGCLAVGVACLLPVSWGWVALFLAAVGSALFHTGTGGESVSFARGYFLRVGLIFSTGCLGAALGGLLASTGFPAWVLSLLLGICSLGCYFFAQARKYPRRIRSFRHSMTRKLPWWAGLGLTLFPLFVAGLTVSLLPLERTDGAWVFLPALFCLLGRGFGSFAADRFGPRKTSVVCFGAAAVLLTVFTHVPLAYCVGLGFLSAPLSVGIGTAVSLLPSRPHFSFGVCSTAILVGSVFGFFRGAATGPVRFLVAVLLILCVAISAVLYTDHCKMFVIPRSKRKGEKA